MQKIKFHTFDALRFFSFLIVFISHIPFTYFPNSFFRIFEGRGHIGVYFFFVLSGFLITYILLHEKASENKINIKNFFIKRILKIAPLFYLMFMFAFFTSSIIKYLNLPSSDVGYTPNWFFSFFFLENYQIIINNSYANISPLTVTWSLCVEEHFYIIWGLLLFFLNKQKVPIFIILFIIIANVSRYFFIENNLKTIDILTCIDFFMYGAIPAYLLIYYYEKFNYYLNSIPFWFKILVIAANISIIFFSGNIDLGELVFLENNLYGISFSILICIIITKKHFFKISDSTIFSKLGIYTYGLYLIHTIAINLVEKLFLKYNFQIQNNFTIFILASLLLTILSSILSYHFFEKPFLKLKQHF